MILLIKSNSVTAFEEIPDKNGKLSPTLTSSDEDEIDLDNKLIRQVYDIEDFNSCYIKQEKFNKKLKEIKFLSKIQPMTTIK
jgi:hypothetical protein